MVPLPWRAVVWDSDPTRPAGTPDRPGWGPKRLAVAAELVALALRSCGSVERFFRGLNCILGCRHLLSQGENGVSIQVYGALIASLRSSVWGGRPPTTRPDEMLCCSRSGGPVRPKALPLFTSGIDELHHQANLESNSIDLPPLGRGGSMH